MDEQLEELIQQARDLNLIKTIKTTDRNFTDLSKPSSSKRKESNRGKKKPQVVQYLKYLVIIDFEATCWDRKTVNQHEIIEFPAILFNVQTGKIENEFREYVKPSERPRLSAFCTELTGITQDQVACGRSIKEVLILFQKWLGEILILHDLTLPKSDRDKPNGDIALVTWSDWDFGICLKRELIRKSIKKPFLFNQWIDLKAIYMKRYNYRPLNFRDSLAHLHMEFEGRPHCGLDDARNAARLAGRMVKDGALFYCTTDLVPEKFCIRPCYY